MRTTRYAISWIYGEFRIARLQQGYPLESWTAPYAVQDLVSLTQAMADCGEHIDLTRGGDVAIAYEDDLHTHEFFNVPTMQKKDLEKLLQRKVEFNKPFEDAAAWCYHEAKHSNEEEGILLHRMPKRIVDAVIRICQEFYLAPKRLVPLTEIVSEVISRHDVAEQDMVAVIAFFHERTEIVVTLGNGETLFVRELSYAVEDEKRERLQTDVNRTLHYCRQQFGKPINSVWLLGEESEQIRQWLQTDTDVSLLVDDNALDPLFWAVEVARLPNRLSANFIPLLARKKINRVLFARVAVWAFPVVVLASLSMAVTTERIRDRQHNRYQQLVAEQDELQEQIDHIQSLVSRRDQSMKKLSLLQADNRNLPALLLSHLGDLVPPGLVLMQADIHQQQEQWRVSLSGESPLNLQQVVDVLDQLEQALQQPPWNMAITTSWKTRWFQQLQTGAAATPGVSDFEIVGWMR